MKEDIISFIWKFQGFNKNRLVSTTGEHIEILSVGLENKNAGPDFFNSKVIIDNQKWAGNVEIHVKSSDWYVHGHESDKNYDNVILHVVWDHDVEIYGKDKMPIPTLELKGYASKDVINNYQKLFSKPQKWINCENDIGSIDTFFINNWLERLYIERLERKSIFIQELLDASKNNWEAVLFKLLAKNFGLKVNAEAFFEMADALDFGIIMKERYNLQNLEALLFGQAGFLKEDIQDGYYIGLQKEYKYLKSKHSLRNTIGQQFQFFRLRPNNFPTIRIAQLAAIINQQQNLFSKIMSTVHLKDFYKLFTVNVSEFWKSHYSFTSSSKKSSKKLTKSFVDLLLINTIIPLKFAYLKYTDDLDNEDVLETLRQVKSEKNSIIDKFSVLNIVSKNALESQALLQLKNKYCSNHKCLQCNIGNSILNKSSRK